MARAGFVTRPVLRYHSMFRFTSRCIILAVSSVIGLPASIVHAGDLTIGKAKAQSICQTCHGMDGQATTAMVPNLSGQQKQYLVIQLEAFRSGKRQHAQMNIVAQMLTDDEIDNVAEWYSDIKVFVEAPEL